MRLFSDGGLIILYDIESFRVQKISPFYPQKDTIDTGTEILIIRGLLSVLSIKYISRSGYWVWWNVYGETHRKGDLTKTLHTNLKPTPSFVGVGVSLFIPTCFAAIRKDHSAGDHAYLPRLVNQNRKLLTRHPPIILLYM